MNAKSAIRNKTWAELNVGDAASLERRCSPEDLLLFAHVSGNVNPLTLPAADNRERDSRQIAPSMWVGSLISAVLGNVLPGAGTLYRAQGLRFPRRVHVGDRLKVTVVCREKREEPIALFDTRVENEYGHTVCEGTAEVDAPTTSQLTEARDLPALIVDSVDHFAPLIALAAQLPPLKTACRRRCPEGPQFARRRSAFGATWSHRADWSATEARYSYRRDEELAFPTVDSAMTWSHRAYGPGAFRPRGERTRRRDLELTSPYASIAVDRIRMAVSSPPFPLRTAAAHAVAMVNEGYGARR